MPAFFSPDNQPRESDVFSYPQYELLRDTARDHADIFAMSLSGGLRPALFDDAGGASENIRAELRKQGTLNPRPREVTDPLFAKDSFFDPRDLVQVKYFGHGEIRSLSPATFPSGIDYSVRHRRNLRLYFMISCGYAIIPAQPGAALHVDYIETDGCALWFRRRSFQTAKTRWGGCSIKYALANGGRGEGEGSGRGLKGQTKVSRW